MGLYEFSKNVAVVLGSTLVGALSGLGYNYIGQMNRDNYFVKDGGTVLNMVQWASGAAIIGYAIFVKNKKDKKENKREEKSSLEDSVMNK